LPGKKRAAAEFFQFCEIKQVDMSTYCDIITLAKRREGTPTMAAKTKNAKLTPLPALEAAAECLRTLAHPHRLRIIQMLLRGRYTVGELAEACGIPSHMASEHLRLMQRCGLLISEKEGRKAFYEIAEPHLANIMQCVEARFDQ
jgi:DNA-binding transcriptional ArsR family regulator